jgi:hypothetical protein
VAFTMIRCAKTYITSAKLPRNNLNEILFLLEFQL